MKRCDIVKAFKVLDRINCAKIHIDDKVNVIRLIMALQPEAKKIQEYLSELSKKIYSEEFLGKMQTLQELESNKSRTGEDEEKRRSLAKSVYAELGQLNEQYDSLSQEYLQEDVDIEFCRVNAKRLFESIDASNVDYDWYASDAIMKFTD